MPHRNCVSAIPLNPDGGFLGGALHRQNRRIAAGGPLDGATAGNVTRRWVCRFCRDLSAYGIESSRADRYYSSGCAGCRLFAITGIVLSLVGDGAGIFAGLGTLMGEIPGHFE